MRTVLIELSHEQTVRQHDHIHVPGLALAIAQLIVSPAQLLLTVPMKGLRSCPAISIVFRSAKARSFAERKATLNCWAHLKRDFQALVDGGPDGAVMGERLLIHLHAVFDHWHAEQ